MNKQEIREKYKNLRKMLSNAEREQLSVKISELFTKHFKPAGKKISCFVPIERLNEINTWHILDAVQAEFYLPVMTDNDQLIHVKYEGKEFLKKNSFGILEPKIGTTISADKLDLVIVPLLAIDDKGFRVGYGKGYYDRFLKSCKPDCLFIGLHYFDEFEKIDDVHSADIALHYCVTPKRILNFRK